MGCGSSNSGKKQKAVTEMEVLRVERGSEVREEEGAVVVESEKGRMWLPGGLEDYVRKEEGEMVGFVVNVGDFRRVLNKVSG